MLKSILSFILLFVSCFLLAQDKVLPEELGQFVPAGHEYLDFATGDLNADKRPDAILILREIGEDSLTDAEKARPMLILIRQSNGKLKQVARNDNAVMCRHCGGVFGDPFESITITPKGFELSFYGGSNWRWSYVYTFIYRAAKTNWFLWKEKQVTMNTGDPEGTTTESTIPETETGEIPFSKFASSMEQVESKWKVVAAKTYFFDSPVLGSKPRKGYLVKGNVAMGFRQLKNFIEISFDDGKDNFTHGYILKKDLVKLK